MIKVIIAITGLGLADLMDGSKETDVITIHLPETADFSVPGVSDLQGHVFDDHNVHALRKKGAPPFPEIPAPFQLSVTVPWNGAESRNDLRARRSFPDLTLLFGGKDLPIRTECQFGPTSLNDCVAKNKDGTDTKLLAAQVLLTGTWTLTAADTDGIAKDSARTNPLSPMVRFRTATLDPAISISHPYTSAQMANTLVFTARINQPSEVAVTVLPNTTITYTDAELTPKEICRAYDPTMPDCIVIRIENHRKCPDGICPLPNWARDGADTHFLQLYRLLDKFDSSTNTLTLGPMMPFPMVNDDPTYGPPGGGSSPRCYPAVVGSRS